MLQNVSNEVSYKDLLIEEPKTANECLSTVEVPNERSTDCTTPNKENLQDAPEDHKTSTSSEAKETTLSLEEQSLAENSQEIIGNSIIEAADKKELAVEVNLSITSSIIFLQDYTFLNHDCLSARGK